MLSKVSFPLGEVESVKGSVKEKDVKEKEVEKETVKENEVEKEKETESVKEKKETEKEVESVKEKETEKETVMEREKNTNEAEPEKDAERETTNPPQEDTINCPICGMRFPTTMSLRQRTRHVNACLSGEHTPAQPRPKKSDDDLWEQESEAAPPSKRQPKEGRADVSGVRGRRVIHDDGEDSYYNALLFSYLQWRRAVRTNDPSVQTCFENYHLVADSIYEWPAQLQSVSDRVTKEALAEYYHTEPALLLPSGYAIPQHVWEVLYPYQRKGVEWILSLHSQGVGGIVADEMGLGKTLQIVAALVALKFTQSIIACGRDITSLPRTDDQATPATAVDLNPRRLPSLLIVPATLLGHWLRELRHWCPLLRSVVMHSTSQTVADGASLRSVLLQCRAKHRYDVIITTYEGIRLSTYYTKQEWFYAILDEGGKIKNAKVGVSRACKQLRTVHRLLISGTPLQNNLKELWSLIDFVFPGRLGTIEAFVSSFVVPISRGIYSNATRQAASLGYQCSLMLQDSISPFILRRLKKDVKKELPPKTEQVLSCLLTPQQEKKYLDYLQSEQVQSSLLGRVMPFKAIVRLRQICNHPVFYQSIAKMGATTDMARDVTLRHEEGMFYREERKTRRRQEEEEEEEEIDYDHVDWKEWGCEGCMMRRSSKMLVMNEVLHIWRKEGHKVLVYTQTVSMLNIIEHYVKEQGFSYCRMDGSTPIVKRQALVDLFNTRGDVFLFLLTTRVGGLGINLIGADRVILFDPDWNPSVDIQARERCWRIGQKKPVTVYRLITSGTIEEKIYHRQIFKTVLSNRVLGEGNDLCSFTSTNLNDLFSYCGGVWGV